MLNLSSAKRLILGLAGLAILVWTLVVSASLVWNIHYVRTQTLDMAYAEATANLNKDITIRRWVTGHGGVYVPITEQQKSVPWLDHVPGRDVTTTEGRQLTLLNPASVLRQIMDRYANDFGIRGRITGLRQLNPDNAPDAWEKQQLEVFTSGSIKEVWAVADLQGQPHLRYLRAMFMEPGCEKCHAILGYKLGDLRGATGLNLPLAPYYRQIDSTRLKLSLSHLLIWLLGLAGIIGSWRAARRAEQALAESEFRWKFAVEGSGDGVWDWNIQTDEAQYSRRWKEMLGYGEDDILPTNQEWASRVHPDDKVRVAATMQAYLEGKTAIYVVEYRLRCKDEHYKWILDRGMVVSRTADGQPLRMIGTHSDISSRKQMEEQVRQLAFHDALTQLPNRRLLNDRLSQTLAASARSGRYGALMFLDLDNFKILNDTHGHGAGDLLLMEVASRLKSCIRAVDTVARFGGDEFVVMLGELEADKDESTAQAGLVAEKIHTALAAPYWLALKREGLADALIEHHCTASIGVVLFVNHEEKQADLLKWADMAMYQAKAAGRNSIRFFDPQDADASV